MIHRWRCLSDWQTQMPSFPFFCFLISLLGVNMLVKGSLLIRALNGLTSPNPIQWPFYTANAICPAHNCMRCFRFSSLFVNYTSICPEWAIVIIASMMGRSVIAWHWNSSSHLHSCFNCQSVLAAGTLATRQKRNDTFKETMRRDEMLAGMCLSICVCKPTVLRKKNGYGAENEAESATLTDSCHGHIGPR